MLQTIESYLSCFHGLRDIAYFCLPLHLYLTVLLQCIPLLPREEEPLDLFFFLFLFLFVCLDYLETSSSLFLPRKETHCLQRAFLLLIESRAAFVGFGLLKYSFFFYESVTIKSLSP